MRDDFFKFFGLRENPFKLTPDPRYYFLSKKHEEAIYALQYLYQSEEGFAVIIGEPGTGKTLTVRKFIDELSRKSKYPQETEVAYILFPNLSPEELFLAILEDLKLNIPDNNQNISKNKLFSIFRDYLIQKKNEGKKVFIIIDEAQNLPIETLEELRILSNLETENEKLLQILLLGQPELEKKLNDPRLRQLKQRITLFIKLEPLNEKEIEDYIKFRISKATDKPIDIDKKAVKLIEKYSKGIPRIINQIMDRALIAAYMEEKRKVSIEEIKAAIKSLNLTLKEKDSKILKITIPVFSFFIIIFLIVAYGNKEIFIDKNKSKIEISENSKQTKNLQNIPQENEEKQIEKKYYILYLLATPNIEEAKAKKTKFEKMLNRKIYLLQVKDGKYYALALLFEDFEKAKKEKEYIKSKLNKKDIFLTKKKYSPVILEY
ncbi:ExeA family protein [Hydrogenothermus marinus]|uniref:General secretion pathway protein A n=1 Tax=Hydrogenothermus marinus TaxID=133270 RepID=A0A3M0C3I6_9AQUI|nr:AAA family ATPase [Hydrogenothermus marinus]RMA97532.1 general secretion pathway protein A [Hydrogenothermus marinus]